MAPLHVHVHPADDHACGWYRLLWPTQHLATDPNLNIQIGARLDCLRQSSDLLGDRPIEILVDADVIVFQRPLKRALVEIIPLLQRQGTAVVVEVDDDFHSLPPGHPARASFAPRHHPDRNWRWLKHACELADLVTCTTPALAERYAPHGRSAVLPNCVPDHYLDIRTERDDRVTVGWTGTPLTHVGDLDVCGHGVAAAQMETGFRFRAIGSVNTLELLGVTGEVVGWVDLLDGYPEAVASLDVQLVPLADNRFNASKSALKMKESAALGVVPVASPSPDNLRMHAEGVGVVAGSPAEWAALLVALASDERRRVELATRGREVMRSWTYSCRAHLWAEAWERAVTYRQSRSSVAVA